MILKQDHIEEVVKGIKTDYNLDKFNQQYPLRILLLEDSHSDAELEAYHLGDLELPYTLKHVLAKEEFLNSLFDYKPHLIISDYQLPQYTGKEALVAVRKLCPYLPFVMCTGRVNEETAVECLKLGADDYVLKDDLNRLPSAVHAAFNSKKNRIQKDYFNEKLRKSEESLRAITKNSPSNIYTIDKDGTIIYSTNSRVETVVNVGTNIYDHCLPCNHEKIKDNILRSFKLKEDVEFEIEGSHSPPFYDWYLCKMGPILTNGEVESLVFIPHKITELRKAHTDLERLNERLNQLNNHLESVRDEEKKKLAMEIHDQLGQELTGNKLGLFWLKQNIENNSSLSKNELVDKLDDLIELSTVTINTTRRIAHELRPVVLDDIGLIAALEWHISNFNKFRDHIKCELIIDSDIQDFDHELSTAVYRIIQESLTNIDKHSKATECKVDLMCKKGLLSLAISDNGVGLDPKAALNSKSLGLFGIQERIKQWNGDFDLSSANNGTELLITINLSQDET